MHTLLPILAALAGPFLLSSAALVLQRRGDRRCEARRLTTSARAWLTREASRHTPGLGVQVHALEGVDAYWPGVDVIALSPRTAGGRSVLDWTVAAHELGHALNARSHPLAPQVLPAARLVSEAGWRGFGGALLVAWLLASPAALAVAWVCLLASVVASAVVGVDEAAASRRALGLLEADARLLRADTGVARGAMARAFGLYGALFVGRLLVFLAWPALTVHVLGVAVEPSPWPVGLWLLIAVLIPFLFLRAAQVITQVWRPEPVGSDFRLFTLVHREAQWEFLTGWAILTLVVAAAPHLTGTWAAVAMALAAASAMAPVAAVGRAAILLPVLVALRAAGETDDAIDDAIPRSDEPAPALLAMYADPPWSLRAHWLTGVAWLPMVAVVIASLASG